MCDDLADRVERLSASQGEVEEYIEAIDADLGELEDDYYGTFEDDEDDAEEAFTEDDLVRAECPRCGEEAFFEEAFLYDEGVEISCPECGEILYRSGEHTFEYEEKIPPATVKCRWASSTSNGLPASSVRPCLTCEWTYR